MFLQDLIRKNEMKVNLFRFIKNLCRKHAYRYDFLQSYL
jgi:hypothetical protein